MLKTKEQIKKEIEKEVLKHQLKPYDFFRKCYKIDGTQEQFNYDMGLIIDKALLKYSEEIEKEIKESNWISERIYAEFKKHYLHGLRFEKIAEAKIKAQLISMIKARR